MILKGIKKRLIVIGLTLLLGFCSAFALIFFGSKILSSISLFWEQQAKTNINQTFSEYVTAIETAGSGRLEVAVYETVAIFSETKEKSYVWGTISAGTTFVEIKVPVTYRYHVPLDGVWNIDIDGQVCRVTAPSIKPSLPPAIHTNAMEKRIKENWIRFDGREMMEQLERGITPGLNLRAAANIPLIREHSRGVIAEFIKNWLLQDEKWDDRFHAIVVRFQDEESGQDGEFTPFEIEAREGK